MRVLLHPGFHKTGTSSLQRGAETLSAALEPHLRLMVTADIHAATRAACRYSARPQNDRLRAFAESFAAALAPLDPSDTRALLISSEDLSGHLPGLHHRVETYAAAPALIDAAVATLRARFGPKSEITVLCTTREPRAWQRSVWYQHLRAQRVTEDFDRYRPRLDEAARLDAIVAAIADRLGARARVARTAIEQAGAAPLGPLGVALDLLGVPTAGLSPLPAQNVQPPGAAAELLALNRSGLDDAALAEAKRQLLRRYRAQGATNRPPRA